MERKKRTFKVEERECKSTRPSTQQLYRSSIGALRDLIKDPTFAKQRRPLEEILRTLENGFENERKLNMKCQRLQSEVVANMSKIKAAIQLSEEDKNTIDTLKEELEKAWKVSEEMRSQNALNIHSKSENLSGKSCILEDPEDVIFKSPFNKLAEAEKQWLCERKSLLQKLNTQSKLIESLEIGKKQLEQTVTNMDISLKEKSNEIKLLASRIKIMEEQNGNKKASKEHHYAILAELESNRLQIFELEEEIANKEKCVEELKNENEVKTQRLKGMETEMSELKNELQSFKIQNNNVVNEMGHENRNNNKIGKTKYEKVNRETKSKYVVFKNNMIQAHLSKLERDLNEKINLLSAFRSKNQLLNAELSQKMEHNKILSTKCDSLQEKTNKSSIVIKQLEKMRDKYVGSIGDLEAKVFELKKELSVYEYRRFPETIDSLNNELLNLRHEIGKEKENSYRYKESLEVIRSKKDKLEELLAKYIKQLQEVLLLIDEFENDLSEIKISGNNSILLGDEIFENNDILLKNLRDKIGDIIEFCKELMAEKNKLQNEINSLKKLKENSMHDELGNENIMETWNSNGDQILTSKKDTLVNPNTVEKINSIFIHADEAEEENIKSTEEGNTNEYENYLKSLKIHKNDNDFHTKYTPPTHVFSILTEEHFVYNTAMAPKSEESSNENIQEINAVLKSPEIKEEHTSQSLITETDESSAKSELIIPQQLKRYGNQLKFKTKALQLLDSNFDPCNFHFNVHNETYKKDFIKKNQIPSTVKKSKSRNRPRKDSTK